MAKFIVAGSASGMPAPGRSHASLVFDSGNRSYLLDVGEGCSSSLLRCGVDHHRIGTIFISHMHPDHCSGLPMLLQMMYLDKRTSSLEVCLPGEGVTCFADWLTGMYVFPEKLPFPFTMSPIHSGIFFEDGTVRLSAVANEHLQGYRALAASNYPQKTFESYSFVIEWEGKRAVYSGDVSSSHDLIPHIAGADVLFLEITHVGFDEIAPFLAERGVKRTILVHIPPELENGEDHIRSVASKFGVESVSMAAEGQEISP